mmetsp:Transcript_32671/g.76184  ORF Transcript_32671/g.76184 Transcript_32671/m.76184 type:complete len:212 (-) Transcript_32671:333-968(-)
MTTRRPSKRPSSSKRAAKASNSLIETKRLLASAATRSSRSGRTDTHESVATASAASCHTPSARITPRRPHWPFRKPDMCTITVGTRNSGMHSRFSIWLACGHFQASAWHCLNEGKKAPYGKCEKSHSGASSIFVELALPLPGTRNGATFTPFHSDILHKWTTLAYVLSGRKCSSCPRAGETSPCCIRLIHWLLAISLRASADPLSRLKRAS